MFISTYCQYYVYILLCENGAYYTGYTNNLAKCYQSHLDETGKCKYTRSFKPFGIAQCWQVNESKSLAMQLEKKIKQLSRPEKEALISNPAFLSTDNRVQPLSKQALVALISVPDQVIS